MFYNSDNVLLSDIIADIITPKNEGLLELIKLQKSFTQHFIKDILNSKLTETIFEVSRELNEESPLPYYFDIIDYDSIESTDLKSHIDRVGREIYERKI